ncbi:Outer membrane protein Omp4 [Helicobacter bizzozeronii]|uniref:outer membrane protein n=1 Tax=Helicobacter bizzozeronii TaxID=56877 RepID=UPI00244D9304|nr:outer membrane protein [Helicobacter bizzozeronii]GMB93070.1 Outer membrane protein Omp4 [Helicobacter bizzozeronii]
MKKYMVAGAIPLVAMLLAAEESPKKPQEAKASAHKKVRASQGRHGERNGFFIGGDYQLGMMSSTEQACSPTSVTYHVGGTSVTKNISTCDGSRSAITANEVTNFVYGNMGNKNYMGYLHGKSYVTNGLGVLMGYKHFFKKLPELGLRYYGFFDWAHSYYRYFQTLNSGPQDIYQQTNVFAYGVGTDLLFNPKPFNKENFHFGFFLGVAIGGTSFAPTSTFFNQLLQAYGTRLRTSNFQFFVNGGIRVGSRHNGFEFGIKIPTIGTNYFYSNGAKAVMNTPYSLTLHRNFVFYWRYMVSF